jgi:hypothetical protein
VSIERFFTRQATVTHPAVVSGYGDATRLDYTVPPATTETVMGWLARYSVSQVTTDTRDTPVGNYIFRCPADSNIGATDRLTVDGQDFKIQGEPWKAPTPGGAHHLVVSLDFP